MLLYFFLTSKKNLRDHNVDSEDPSENTSNPQHNASYLL